MKDFFRQNGVLLLVIALLLSILLGVSSALMGGNADPLSNVVNTVTSPVRIGVTAVLNWVEGVYNYVFHYQEMQDQLTELQEELAKLQEQVRDGLEASRENEQLRELLELKSRRRELDLDTARITARSTDNWESTLTISKGSSSDIEAGDCVITSTGVLVGVVREVGLNYAIVSTIINTDIEMGGIVERTYSAGILEGDFALMQEGKLKMSYLPEGAQLVAGDEVVTSGRGDVYPAGLVVGSVEGVFTDPSGMTRYAVVIPDASLDALIEVAVIKDFQIEE